MQEGKYRATFALKYNNGTSCACILNGSLAHAFSYLQGACVGLHLYEAGDENKDEGKPLVFGHFGGKLKERHIFACELPHLSLAEGVFSEMLSVEDKRERDPSMTILLSLTDIR